MIYVLVVTQKIMTLCDFGALAWKKPLEKYNSKIKRKMQAWGIVKRVN